MSASIESAFGTAMTEDEYGQQWVASSAAMDRDNDYGWMAAQLGPKGRVLDVGAGGGRGLHQLAKLGARVLCVEINPRLIQEATTFLALADVPVTTCRMADVLAQIDGPPGSVLLVNGDLMDPVLDTLPFGSFAAVTCWLIGANPAQIEKTIGTPIAQHSNRTGVDYRKVIQGRCRDLALQLLSPGGALHLVDRAYMSSWNHKTGLRHDGQREKQAELGAGFAVAYDDVLFRRSGLGRTASKVQLIPNQPLPAAGVTALQSILARRL